MRYSGGILTKMININNKLISVKKDNYSYNNLMLINIARDFTLVHNNVVDKKLLINNTVLIEGIKW